jgi:hypothetical protein
VEDLGDGKYSVLAGERRIRAAHLAGWKTIECVVRPRSDPLQAHTLRLVENLHRRDLHPLDEAAALKIAWLAANADAMGLGHKCIVLPGTTAESLPGCITGIYGATRFQNN